MSNQKSISFEKAISRLEEIVKNLENQTAPLDSSLELFEEGVALVKTCTKMLDEAEQRVKVVTRSEDGDILEAEFTVKSE